jgi:UDP-glucose 6-dehydrogenase
MLTGMKKFIEKWQGVITLILFMVSVIGWVVDSQVNKKLMKAQLDANTKQVEKLVESINDQKTLNGRFIMYIELDSKQDGNDSN